MTRREKALARLAQTPPASDLTWDELKTALEGLGYVEVKGDGSRRKFFHQGKQALFLCHRPHHEMNILKYKGYEGTTEIDMSIGMCRGKLLFIDDLVSYEAETPAALQKAFEAAVQDYLATCKALGKEPQRPLKGLFNVRVSPEMHKDAVLRAMAEGVYLNNIVNEALNLYLYGAPPRESRPATRNGALETY